MRATEFVTEKVIHETQCPRCGGAAMSDPVLAEKQDACYHKVRSRYKVWPSAYASGALVQCRKKGAANWGNKAKKESMYEAGYAHMRGADAELKKMFAPSASFRTGDRVRGRFSDTTEPLVGVVTDFDAKTGRAVVQDAQGRKFFVHAQNLVKNKDTTLTELTGYGADKKYQSMDSYKRYDIYVSRKKFNNLYFIAVAENPRTLQAKFKTKGDSPQQALDALKAAIDQEIETAPKVSGQATLDFNVDFVREILEGDSGVFYAKIVAGPKLVLAGPDMLEYPEIMRDEGFKPSTIRTVKGGEGTTKLPAVPLSSKSATAANIIANGRYVLGQETRDKDGNRVFDLEFDSVVSAANEKMRLKTPAVTVGTLRSQQVGEMDLDEGWRQKAAAAGLAGLMALGGQAQARVNVDDPNSYNAPAPLVQTQAARIDYTKPGPVTKDSMGQQLEYGVPVTADGNFKAPDKQAWYDGKLSDKEYHEQLSAYKQWRADFSRRWPSATFNTDGSAKAVIKPGLAPVSPGAVKQQVNEGLKEKAAAIVMSLGLLGPMAAQNANAFNLGDVARALPMVVGAVNQNRGLENSDIMRRVITQEINQYRADERQFDRWFAHQLQDPRDRNAFRLAAQEKEFWQARAMNMRSSSDAAKAAAAVGYYTAVRNNLAEKYGITVPR